MCGELRRLAQQVGQLGLDIDVVGLLAGRHHLVRLAKEVGDLLDRRLEVRLAERRRQLQVQYAAGSAALGAARRPYMDVAQTLATLDARGQQVSREDPLNGLVE